MNKYRNHFITTFFAIIFSFVIIVVFNQKGIIKAAVPNEYIANHEIKTNRDKTL
jgi:hypothetical protein